MSYSEELITKLSHDIEKETCCNLAILSAVVKVDGSIHLTSAGPSRLELKINNMALARQIAKLFKSLFAINSEINLRRVNIGGSSQSQILIEHPQLKNLLNKLGIVKNDEVLNLGLPNTLLKRSCCKKSFVRGTFMAGGYISQDSKGAHLEITSENHHLINQLNEMLNRQFIISKTRKKGHYYSLYLKTKAQISNFLKYIGAGNEALELENTTIVKNLKNLANRLANAETANQDKVIKNAFRQIKDIRNIENKIGLSNLSEGLQQICQLRIEYPQDSLAGLGAKANPVLSKSAVNHRLRRIRQIAEKLGN